jgi:protein involved in polysaccharide export with SLBB domain
MPTAPAQENRSVSEPAPLTRKPDRVGRKVSEWDTDNLDMVSASASAIREVLEKDPGLMMELKRLMAKQATDEGQIVSEQDLEDPVILDRLEKDTHFRALATRLLQRYGYLTPQVNPKSFEGREQDLFLRARAERLARGTQDVVPASTRSRDECEPGSDNRPCVSSTRVTTETSRDQRYGNDNSTAPEGESAAGTCEEDDQDDPECLPVTGSPQRPSDRTAPEEQPDTEPRAPQMERPDLDDSLLLTASAASASATDFQDVNLPGGSPWSANEAEAARARSQTGQGGQLDGFSDLQSSPGSALAAERRDNLESLPSTSRANGERSGTRTLLPSRPYRPPRLPEPVEMLKSPSPYAFIPSLYDLYVQAAPRTAQLERFGLEAFRRVPRSTTRLPMDLPAGPDYVLGPGDQLTIDLWGGVSQRLFRTVDREGRLSLPESGPLVVNGRSLGDVQEVVQRVLRTQYRDVSADVALTRLRTVRVYVVGEVVSPGAYDISSLSTPLNALWTAGGVTSRGSLRLLRHNRSQEMVQSVDVYDLLLRGTRGDLRNFENGDTLLVPPVGPQVTVDGMVRRPAIYELHNETNLAQVLDLAGGMLPAAALRHIEVQRLEAHEKRIMLSLNVDDASDPEGVHRQLTAFAVHDGDEVHIFPIAPYNSATVYLQGHVLRPGRYAYTSGMTVADLLSSYQDLLPEPAEHYAEIIRLHQPDWRPVVENFDLEAALARPSMAPKLEPLDTVRIFGRYDVEAPPVVWLYGEVRVPGEYRTTGQMHLRDAIYQAGGLRPDAALDSVQLFRTQASGEFQILNVNLAAALNADPMENVLVQPRDRILVHRSLYRVDPPSVYVRGEVANPGRYPLAANMRLSDLVGAAGGARRGADLKHGDLTRYQASSGGTSAGEHERVDLTALTLDPARNLSLRDGDVLSVPQLPGWNSLGASVTLKGEVKNPGVYGIQPGERLSSVLKRAGGLLPTAYPQGVIFTRVSVRELQEKSRQDLIQRLEQEGPLVKSSITSSATEEAALQAEAMQQRDRALDALRRAPVSGRLVVRIPPGAKGLDKSSQDIELLNGDSVEIPRQPGFVLVIGQVYNTNAVTYVPGKNAGWYLGQGGGATALGDKGAIFIIRADGEVEGRRGTGWWSGNVLSAPIRPGDTLVVPERPVSGSARWKNLIALAQVAEAGAITAAILP